MAPSSGEIASSAPAMVTVHGQEPGQMFGVPWWIQDSREPIN